MPKKIKKARVFSRAFKQAAVERMLAGENISALARELELRRKLLYHWKARYRQGGPAALGGAGRPPRQPPAVGAAPVPATTLAALAEASTRIAALERKVGQQAMELDFFVQALRHLQVPADGTGSSRPSTSKRRKAN